MALVQQASGTQTATLDTEHTLATRTDGKSYILVLDCAEMVDGDILRVRLKVKTLSSSSAIVYNLLDLDYATVQNEPVLITVPVPAVHEFQCSIEQTDGGGATPTGKDYEWSVVSLD